jgi:prepilin-type N-terminal cleavage/methylation domain-containing protein
VALSNHFLIVIEVLVVMFNKSFRRAHKGFTLAELLIALAILGVIATFTIPKILTSSQSGQNAAVAKEAASMISAAYTTYTLQNSITTGTTAGVLTQYMNYVSVDTATTYGSMTACSATNPCLKLHNGGVLQYGTVPNFSATTGVLNFVVDPDGAGTVGPVEFVQFYNGRFTTNGANGGPGTASAYPLANVNTDPSYIQNWN